MTKSLEKIVSCIDLTTLNNTDTRNDVSRLIQTIHPKYPPAAICTFPNLIEGVRKQLMRNVKLAVVGGNFPIGQLSPMDKGFETLRISQLDIDEVDVVINKGYALEARFDLIESEVMYMKSAIAEKQLKVILETGELKDPKRIENAATAAINGGADFIKTSTGKTSVGATEQAIEIMASVIHNHWKKTGKRIGIKPSGGIRTPKDALRYTRIIENILGEEWITPSLFRIGASSLYTSIISEIEKQTA